MKSGDSVSTLSKKGSAYSMDKWTQEQVDTMIRLHGMWLGGEERYGQARFEYADLSDLDLSHADLSLAEFFNVTMHNANVSDSNLDYAFMSCIDATEATFSGSSFRHCGMYHSIFQGVDFSYAQLIDSWSEGNDFNDANFRGAESPVESRKAL